MVIHTRSETLTRIQYVQAQEKWCYEAESNPCPGELVVEIVSTDLVGTLNAFRASVPNLLLEKMIPTRLVVEGLSIDYVILFRAI